MSSLDQVTVKRLFSVDTPWKKKLKMKRKKSQNWKGNWN